MNNKEEVKQDNSTENKQNNLVQQQQNPQNQSLNSSQIQGQSLGLNQNQVQSQNLSLDQSQVQAQSQIQNQNQNQSQQQAQILVQNQTQSQSKQDQQGQPQIKSHREGQEKLQQENQNKVNENEQDKTKQDLNKSNQQRGEQKDNSECSNEFQNMLAEDVKVDEIEKDQTYEEIQNAKIEHVLNKFDLLVNKKGYQHKITSFEAQPIRHFYRLTLYDLNFKEGQDFQNTTLNPLIMKGELQNHFYDRVVRPNTDYQVIQQRIVFKTKIITGPYDPDKDFIFILEMINGEVPTGELAKEQSFYWKFTECKKVQENLVQKLNSIFKYGYHIDLLKIVNQTIAYFDINNWHMQRSNFQITAWPKELDNYALKWGYQDKKLKSI